MRYKPPSRERVARLREQYPEGARVELVSMSDPQTTLRPGDKGTVSFVDDIGTIFVDWDNGSGLGIVYGEDSVKKVEKEIQYDTGADFWCHIRTKKDMDDTMEAGAHYLFAQLKTDIQEERQFCRELFVAMMEDTMPRADPGKLVYPYSFEVANEYMETSLYHEGCERNTECAQAIDRAINASCYKTYHYNLELAAMSVVQEYGFPRVNSVLAHNLQRHEQDGRYSRDNKDWAGCFTLADKAFDSAYLKAHPILVEDFTKYTRKLYEDTGAERFEIPGAPEAGHVVQDYEITRSIWLDNNRGFAIGHNPDAVEPFVSWQFTPENDKRDFYWGHYFKTEKDAADDYIARVIGQMKDGQAREIDNPLADTELSAEQNYNMVDGMLNNEKDRLDLTDGQTHEEIQELATETLPQEKPSVIKQIREAKDAPPTPHKPKDGHRHEDPEL